MADSARKNTSDNNLIEKYPDMVVVRVLSSPSTFGELAIEKERLAKRTATIVSKGTTYLLKYPIGVYRKIKRYTEDPQIRANSIFINKIPIF